MKRTIIWLDDIRNPKLPDFALKYGLDFEADDIRWLKNYAEFTKFLSNNGLPYKVYFDHDLGPGKDGYAAAKYLVDYCIENGLALPEYESQSANPVGRVSILKLLGNFAAFQEAT